jgi:hypothetical protein
VKCPQALDPIDIEALASGGSPVCDPGAAEHVTSCPACRERVEVFGLLGSELDLLGSVPEPAAVLAGFDRLRPFSSRERRSLRLWTPPLLLAAALLLASALILALPLLSVSEQASLATALLASAAGELRALAQWGREIFQSFAPGVAAGSDLALADRTAAAAALLLLIPGGWSLVRLLAARSQRR